MTGAKPFFYAVTIAELPDRHGRGTHVNSIFFDRDSAQNYAESRERTHLWMDGKDVSRDTVTDARVVPDHQLGGPEQIAEVIALLWPEVRVKWEATGASVDDLWPRLAELGVDKAVVQGLRPDIWEASGDD